MVPYSEMDRLTELLARGPVLFDGAMGTQLMRGGIPPGQCLEELNLTQPALVRSVHGDYIAAGADVIETNTFRANRFGLGEHYLESRVHEVNRAGARLAAEARNASGRSVLVAGSIGPLGRPIEPVGAIKRSSAERIFREQAAGLLEGGVDLFCCETFTAINELALAVEVLRQLAPEVPVVASLSFGEETGEEEATIAVAALLPLGVAAIGVNCGSGPEAALEAVRHLVSAGAPTVLAMPNAGLPQRVGGRLQYTASPDYFADAAARLLEAGARLVGGCCGTGPEHVAAMRRGLRRASRATAPLAIRSPRPVPATPAAPASGLARDLGQRRFVVSVELTPPRGIDPRRMLAGARLLKEAGAGYANVTDAPMARLRMGVISCAALIQQQVGLEAIAHFTCRDRNVMAIQSDLIGAHALGVRNVLALRGDPPSVGDYPHATAVWDVSTVGLLTILANLNRGLDANGTPIGERAAFFFGAAFNPAAPDSARELRLLQRKIAAGAAFLVTNPVYEHDAVRRLQEASACGVPLLVGVMPLTSHRQAEYLHHEVPGISVPEGLRERMRRTADPVRLGIELAVEQLAEVRAFVQGVYVIPPAGRYEVAAEVVARSLSAPPLPA
jgi:methionine synthase I (cobalamin-dependent)/5,10-methylenetetrahydrofolate reductase